MNRFRFNWAPLAQPRATLEIPHSCQYRLASYAEPKATAMIAAMVVNGKERGARGESPSRARWDYAQ
jgi:hypothetical protein